MKRITLTLIAAASAVALAGCVPSTYGYGNYGGYGNTYGSSYGNRYGSTYPYGGNSYPYGNTYGNNGYYSSRPTYGSDGTFRCESNDQRATRCLVDTRSGVSLVRQDSDAPCIQGRTWVRPQDPCPPSDTRPATG